MRVRKQLIMMIIIIFLTWGCISAVHNVASLYEYNISHLTKEPPNLSITTEWEKIIESEHIIGRDLVMNESNNLYVVGNILNSSDNSYKNYKYTTCRKFLRGFHFVYNNFTAICSKSFI
ncbi:MAG: hypothetical protein ACFFC3_15970 [Candidatus Odinarchaeota archaeon]